jgi:hypothetical protein
VPAPPPKEEEDAPESPTILTVYVVRTSAIVTLAATGTSDVATFTAVAMPKGCTECAASGSCKCKIATSESTTVVILDLDTTKDYLLFAYATNTAGIVSARSKTFLLRTGTTSATAATIPGVPKKPAVLGVQCTGKGTVKVTVQPDEPPLCDFINVVLIPKGSSKRRRLLIDAGVYSARVPYINRPGPQVVTISCPTCDLDVITNGENDIGAGILAAASTCQSDDECPEATICQSGICTEKTCTPSDASGCGGTCAAKCGINKACGTASDCASGYCDSASGTCQVDTTCTPSDTTVGCGGTCVNKCGAGLTCTVNGDCASGTCASGTCQAACTPSDASGCGGTCAAKCGINKACGTASDCASGYCDSASGTCQVDTTCTPSDTTVGCGGTCVNKCGAGLTCTVNGDCASGTCASGTCQAACTPSDASGCGGTCAAKCGINKACGTASDCAIGYCDSASGTCQVDTTCTPSDTTVGCGGTCSPKCADDGSCAVGSDCDGGECDVGDVCCTPSDDSGCGGTCATKCADGLACSDSIDCEDDTCDSGVCCAASDTTVGCGGTCSTKCADDDSCAVGSDCDGGECDAGGVCCRRFRLRRHLQMAWRDCDDDLSSQSRLWCDAGGVCCTPSDDSGCGGTCSTKCVDEDSCAVGNDCDGGECDAGGVCCTPSDDSGCGGTCATKCGTGLACSDSSDCDTENTCCLGTCAPAYGTVYCWGKRALCHVWHKWLGMFRSSDACLSVSCCRKE